MAEGTAARRRPANGEGDVKKGKSLKFELERETKGAVRFAEITKDGEDGVIRTIYLRKELWSEMGEPDEIKVAITAA